jgi:translation initiation factor 2B subunit (eIF-2B alpha/beta/delta family)
MRESDAGDDADGAPAGGDAPAGAAGADGRPPAHVVTCFLREGIEVLVARRSDAVGTYRGRWAGVSGYVEGDPADAAADASRELREETGQSDARLIRAGDPLAVVDEAGGREWTVHPFLFETDTRAVEPNEELAAVEWVQPTAILDRETVPGLWATYEQVAPTAETVRTDETHGSAAVSLRALEVVRDRAAAVAAGQTDAAPDDWTAVAATARAVRDARPSMAAVANRVNRVLSGAARSPAAVRSRAEAALTAAVDADAAAGREAAALLDRTGTDRVATLSRSGTVAAALREARPAVLVGESRPAREGVGVAESLARDGLDVTLATDAALPWLLAGDGDRTGNEAAGDAGPVEAVLVGADAVLADGTVVNKAGTRALGLAAAREDLPLYVVAARDKVRPDEQFHGESGNDASVYDGHAPVTVAVPTFDATPPDLVAGVVTETGVLGEEEVRAAAAGHREAAAWDEAAGGDAG